MNPYKPKSGWKNVGGAVFERDGNRVHLLGHVRLKNSIHYSFSCWPYSVQFHRMIRIFGGNRKRACLAYADYLIGDN